MPDLLQTGSDWLADQLRAYAASAVTYARDATALTVPAVVGGTRTEVVERDGSAFTVERRDFLIQAADHGGLHPPRRGDRVTHGGRQYEVLPHGPDEDVWRWSDGHHKLLRVFAKARAL